MTANTGKPLSPERRQQALDAYDRLGTIEAAHRETGITCRAIRRCVRERDGGGRREAVAPIVRELMSERQPEATTADITAIVRQAVEAELARRRRAGETGKPEVVVEAETSKPKSPRVVVSPVIYSRIAWLSDLHVPYHDMDAINAVLEYLTEWKPDLVVMGGDLFDMYGISRYEKSPEQLGDRLQDEFDAAKPVVKRIDALGSKVAFILGNHDARIDSLVGANPALLGLRALGWHRMAELPPTWDIYPDQTRLRIGHLDFLHGNLRGRGTGARHIGAWMLGKLKRSAIHGHFHRQQEFPEPDGDGVIRAGFAMGHLCDVSKAADYCPVNDWTSGFGTIDMCPESGMFDVRQHLIHGGKFRFGGKTYGG